MVSAPGFVARSNDAAAVMQLICRPSYSLQSGARSRHPLLGVNALIEGVKARVSNYLLAGSCIVSAVNNSPPAGCIPRVNVTAKFANYRSRDKFRAVHPLSLRGLVFAFKLNSQLILCCNSVNMSAILP